MIIIDYSSEQPLSNKSNGIVSKALTVFCLLVWRQAYMSINLTGLLEYTHDTSRCKVSKANCAEMLGIKLKYIPKLFEDARISKTINDEILGRRLMI